MLPLKRGTVCKLALLIFFLSSWCFVIDIRVEAQEAPSGYSLNGTIQSSDLTGAVITVAKGEQSFFRKFERLPDGSQIVGVRPDSILLKRADGTTYEMYILHETKTVASAQPSQPSAQPSQPPAQPAQPPAQPAQPVRPVQPVQPVQTIQPNTGVDPYAPGAIRTPRERPPSSLEKRRGKRKSDLDNE